MTIKECLKNHYPFVLSTNKEYLRIPINDTTIYSYLSSNLVKIPSAFLNMEVMDYIEVSVKPELKISLHACNCPIVALLQAGCRCGGI